VSALNVQPGATFDLNGLHVYARVAKIDGAVRGGSVTLVPDGGDLPLQVPTPGTISAVGEVDDWTFFGRAGATVRVTVATGSAGSPAPYDPAVGYARVSLVAPDGTEVTAAENADLGQDVTLQVEQLPANGTYHIRIQAPLSQPVSAGNYIV